MLERFGYWNLVLIAVILVVEWWLPRQTRLRANSILDLATDLFLAIALTTLAIYLLFKNWRNNGRKKS